MNKLFMIIFISVFLIDRITKMFIPDFCLGFFCMEKSLNKGAFLGILQGFTLLFILLSIAIIILIIFFYKKVRKNLLAILAFSLILAGIFGNLVDRIFYGFVIDFIKIGIFPAFNLADLANTIGALLLIIALVKKKL